MYNVFRVNPSLCPEDRFTTQWCCLLTGERHLGQSVVDRLTQLSGIPTSRLVDVIDHPGGSIGDRPDCLLRTEDFDLICEHKLNAPLGKSQLERYLNLCKSRRSYLLVIANHTLQVPAHILRSPQYLRPKEAGPHQHFLWRDLYPVVARSRGILSRQFREYMDSLGMNPWNWGRFGDPFVDVEAAEAFRRLYDPIVEQLRAKGIATIRRRNSLGLQIKSPDPKVYLLYVAPVKWDGSLDLPLSGRLFIMTAWCLGRRRKLEKKEEFVKSRGPSLYAAWLADSSAHWKPGVFAERDYYSSLDELLVRDLSDSAQNITNVILRAIRHLAV